MVFLKVLEKGIYNWLSHHVHTDTLVREQFGFKQEKSTENTAFKLTDSVLKSVNQKLHVAGIFCDTVI
jgi:hypothetical protein